jgi:hypothetical protein
MLPQPQHTAKFEPWIASEVRSLICDLPLSL